MKWNDIKIDGNPASFLNYENARLYVCERSGRVEAWVDGDKVGNFETIDEAKARACLKVGIPVEIPRSVAKPKKQLAPPPKVKCKAKVETVRDTPKGRRFGDPIVKRFEHEKKLKRFPIANMSEPPALVVAVAPEPMPAPEPIYRMAGYCACGVRLGRMGKCPALCTPVAEEPPQYRGPMVVGRSHIGRIGAPVSW
ncbi:hypothetical protein [Bradyrhizobium sp. Tv2a-2]|uniref:hypothetical protein n=1 Tax=Bradyrhizobium sp. Tv2a-2 TaxID=113395 RepID=UPI0004077443|nr:hypothetical protein [Bradyrhizobium sp. Tv2a-2]